MLPSFCVQTIRRERARLIEKRGAQVRDWDGVIDILEIGGCSVQPASAVRDYARSENVEKGYVLFAPPYSDIELGDRIECGGRAYTIDGEPFIWVSPAGRVSSMQAKLKRWQG